MPYDFIYIWNLKNRSNKQTKQKQTHRYKKQTDGYQRGRGWGMGEKDEEIKKNKLVVTKQSQGYKIQHREYS